MKEKRQFRLFDVYRMHFTGIQSKVKGIKEYYVLRTSDEIEVSVIYCSGTSNMFLVEDESELKEAIRNVNKQLNNCRKPGKKRK